MFFWLIQHELVADESIVFLFRLIFEMHQFIFDSHMLVLFNVGARLLKLC